MSQNEILLKTILPIIFSIPEKFEIYFSGSHRNLLLIWSYLVWLITNEHL